MKHGDTLGQFVDTVMQGFVARLPACKALVAGSTVTGVWVPAHGDVMGSCSNWVSQADVESLPTCTSISDGSISTGVWMPDSAAGNGASLNDYVTQVQAGALSGHPESASRNYREIAAQ